MKDGDRTVEVEGETRSQGRPHGLEWKKTAFNKRTGAREQQRQICGAVQSWSAIQRAWSWDVMPWEPFGLALLQRDGH